MSGLKHFQMTLLSNVCSGAHHPNTTLTLLRKRELKVLAIFNMEINY